MREMCHYKMCDTSHETWFGNNAVRHFMQSYEYETYVN